MSTNVIRISTNLRKFPRHLYVTESLLAGERMLRNALVFQNVPWPELRVGDEYGFSGGVANEPLLQVLTSKVWPCTLLPLQLGRRRKELTEHELHGVITTFISRLRRVVAPIEIDTSIWLGKRRILARAALALLLSTYKSMQLIINHKCVGPPCLHCDHAFTHLSGGCALLSASLRPKKNLGVIAVCSPRIDLSNL